MTLNDLIELLNSDRAELTFKQVLEVIQVHYEYTPTTFKNGQVINLAGTNEGSCKVFAFAKLHGLSQAQTLRCFAEHYQAVLTHPEAQDHANIRNFMQTGWSGIEFEAMPLSAHATIPNELSESN